MASSPCPNCGATVPTGFKFCGHCGYSMPAGAPPPGPPPAAPPPPARRPSPAQGHAARSSGVQLVVLRGPLPEGSTFDLQPGRNDIGRAATIAFPSDSSLDDPHLVVDCHGGGASITEVPGTSGCYRRNRGAVRILSGDTVFAGEQYLVVRKGSDAPQDPVGTGSEVPPETFGTPLPPPQLQVTQLLHGGIPGRVASTDKNTLTVGRENCDLSFPQDRFMSGRHLRVENNNGELTVVDVGSLNGTFSRVADLPVALAAGDEVMIGAVLFRVDFG